MATADSTTGHAAPQELAAVGPTADTTAPVVRVAAGRRTAKVDPIAARGGSPMLAAADLPAVATAPEGPAVVVEQTARVGPSAGPAGRSRHASADVPRVTPSYSIRTKGLLLPLPGRVEDVRGGKRSAAVHEREAIGDEAVDPVLLEELGWDVDAALGVERDGEDVGGLCALGWDGAPARCNAHTSGRMPRVQLVRGHRSDGDAVGGDSVDTDLALEIGHRSGGGGVAAAEDDAS